jgi:hypothetical protein
MGGFVKGIGKAVGGIVKGVANVVKKIAPIILIAAAVYFGGWALYGMYAGVGAGAGKSSSVKHSASCETGRDQANGYIKPVPIRTASGTVVSK